MTRHGALICLTGIDGSGKTTQARLLVDWLLSRGLKATYTWSRGEVLAIRRIFLLLGRGALGTSAHELAHSPASYHQYQSRKSRLMSNPAVRTLWSITTYAEHIAQINTDIRRKVQAGYWVVCDRYQWDTLIDLAVLNHKSSRWLDNGLNRFMWKLIPEPDITFLIDIPAEEAMRRKDDIPTLDYVQKRREHYQYLAARRSLTAIDGCRNPAAIHGQIVAIVGPYMEGKAQL